MNNSYFTQEITNTITESLARQGNLNASTILTSNKAQGYFQELLNATKEANSSAMIAAARKLEAEFATGKEMNWKQWVLLGEGIISTLTGGAGLRMIPVKGYVK